MLNHFSKIIFVFFLYIALQNYAMEIETGYECNQPSYNPEANAELLQITNNFLKPLPTQEDWKNITKCLEKGADPNIKGYRGTNIFELAILAPSYDIKTKESLYDFFKYGANPNIRNDRGYTPLYMLLLSLKKNFDLEMLETLLKYNANPNLTVIDKIPNTQENYIFSPLDFAIKYQNRDSVKILIQHGANINAKGSLYNIQPASPFFHYYITPLVRAMVYNKLEILKVLCREYASLEDVSSFHGGTAFEFALKVLKDPEPIIKSLIVNVRFKLPTTEKKLDLTALTLLLILKNQLKFQIPEDLKFHILSILPAIQNYAEPDSKLYQKLFHKNYKNPYLFSRLEHHITNIMQIVNKENKSGEKDISLLRNNKKTKKIIPQLNEDVASLKSDLQETSPENLALQICNNYEELLEEEQAQNTK